MVLDKKATLFERDEEGKLLPKEVSLVIDENDEEQLELKGEKVMVIPLTRGELRKFFSETNISSDDNERDLDGEIIEKHCVKPSYTKKEVEHMRPVFATVLVNTIFFESGLDTSKTRKKALEDKEDEFAKN